MVAPLITRRQTSPPLKHPSLDARGVVSFPRGQRSIILHFTRHYKYIFSCVEDRLGVRLMPLFSHFWEIFSGRIETLAIVRTLEEESSVVLFSFWKKKKKENHLVQFAVAQETSDGGPSHSGTPVGIFSRHNTELIQFRVQIFTVLGCPFRKRCDSCGPAAGEGAAPVTHRLAAATCRFCNPVIPPWLARADPRCRDEAPSHLVEWLQP